MPPQQMVGSISRLLTISAEKLFPSQTNGVRGFYMPYIKPNRDSSEQRSIAPRLPRVVDSPRPPRFLRFTSSRFYVRLAQLLGFHQTALLRPSVGLLHPTAPDLDAQAAVAPLPHALPNTWKIPSAVHPANTFNSDVLNSYRPRSATTFPRANGLKPFIYMV